MITHRCILHGHVIVIILTVNVAIIILIYLLVHGYLNLHVLPIQVKSLNPLLQKHDYFIKLT